MSRIFYVDIDDVCALLSPVWLRRYNKDYDDNLAEDRWIGWGVHQFVKPECGKKIYNYICDPSIYDEIMPREGSVEGVRELRKMGLRVVFATSTPIQVAGRKFRWLQEHGYQPEEKNYIEIQDKSLLRGSYLFDDRYDNILNFTGIGLLLTRPWNAQDPWFGFRVNNWEETIKCTLMCERSFEAEERMGK